VSNNLSARELCDIIKTCKENGVGEFKFGELCVKFGCPPGAGSASPWLSLHPSDAGIPPSPPCTEESKELQMTDADRVEIDGALLEHRLISDPLGYEDELINGRLQDIGALDEER
jgi:hypothetical protein